MTRTHHTQAYIELCARAHARAADRDTVHRTLRTCGQPDATLAAWVATCDPFAAGPKPGTSTTTMARVMRDRGRV